jgi:glutathione S-transferase
VSPASLHLYTDSSPNGFKITIALEELGIPYVLHHVRINADEHRHPDFLRLHPHGRIPVLVDEATNPPPSCSTWPSRADDCCPRRPARAGKRSPG